MARHLLIVTLLLMMFSCYSFAQESLDLTNVKYQRKSIASIDQVVVLSDEYDLIDPMDVKRIWEPYIALSRFDRNILPDSLSKLFLEAISVSANHTVESLGNLVNVIYATEIQALLVDPVIQKARIEQFKNKHTYTFESGKGNSYSVTASDLEVLFSSAFFYIPYIRNVRFNKQFYTKKIDDKKKKMKQLSLGIDAGVIWYQIKILPDQTVKVEYVDTLKSSSYQSQDEGIYYEDDVMIENLLSGCLTHIGEDFAYNTKQLSAFKLRGRIESANNNSLFLDLSEREGVSLDDYFWIMEDYQVSEGYKSKKIGLSFVSRFVNDQGKLPLSKATQIFGKKHHLGSWVKESPRYGLSLTLNLGYFDGFYIDARDAELLLGSFFTNNVTSALGLDASFSYLLSKSIIKLPVSQLFFDVNAGLAPVNIDYGTLINRVDFSSKFIGGINVGFRKLFWYHQLAFQPFIYIGNHTFQISKEMNFSFSEDDDSDEPVFKLNQAVLKYGFILEKMISPYLLANISFYRTFGLGGVSKHYILNYDQFDETSYTVTADYSSLDWYGVSFGVRLFY